MTSPRTIVIESMYALLDIVKILCILAALTALYGADPDEGPATAKITFVYQEF